MKNRFLSIGARLITLLLAVFVVYAIMLVKESRQWDILMGRVLSNFVVEKKEAYNKIESLLGESLRTTVYDYSWWDEMVDFIRTGDPEWATTNLDEVMGTVIHGEGVWVFTKDFDLVYSLSKEQSGDDTFARGIWPEITKAQFNRLAENYPRGRFFMPWKTQVMEAYMAPVQPGSIPRDEAPVEGWLIAGKIWDEAYLAGLSRITGTTVQILPVDQVEPVLARRTGREKGQLYFTKEYSSLEGKAIFGAIIILDSPVTGNARDFIDSQFTAVILFLLLVLLVLLFFLVRWVILPLRTLSFALADENAELVRPLQKRFDEFSGLARLIERFFEQKKKLEDEIKEREATAEALRQRERELNDFFEQRDSLARKIHDNIIQSLYGLGLSLQNVLISGRGGDVCQKKALESIIKEHNEIIHDLRGYLTSLEPDALTEDGLEASFQKIVRRLENEYPCDISFCFPEKIENQLGKVRLIHFFHFLRGLMMQRITDGGVESLSVIVENEEKTLVVRIEDDGAPYARGMRELDIIRRNVDILQGRIENIPSDEGKNRILIRFPAPPT